MKKLIMTVVALMGATTLFAQTDVVATFQQGLANAKAANYTEAIAQFQEVVEGDDEEVLLFYRNCPNPLCVILLFTWFARARFLIDLISYLVLVDVIDFTIRKIRF